MHVDPKIETLILAPDTVELIRDQIAAILHLELTHQHTLAVRSGLANADDYDIAVYLEKQFAFDVNGGADKFPAVVVQLIQSDQGSGSSAVDATKQTAIFYLDCYGCGNSGSPDADKIAVLKSWKVARLVRNIICSGQYTYLGLRTTSNRNGVNSRKIRSRKTGVPAGIGNGANQVAICRLELEVTFYEFSPQAKGVEYELYDFVCLDDDNKVYFHI